MDILAEHVKEPLRLIDHARQLLEGNADASPVQFHSDAQAGHIQAIERVAGSGFDILG